MPFYQPPDLCSLSEAQEIESHLVVKGKTFGKTPLAVFTFKYRSRSVSLARTPLPGWS